MLYHLHLPEPESYGGHFLTISAVSDVNTLESACLVSELVRRYLRAAERAGMAALVGYERPHPTSGALETTIRFLGHGHVFLADETGYHLAWKSSKVGRRTSELTYASVVATPLVTGGVGSAEVTETAVPGWVNASATADTIRLRAVRPDGNTITGESSLPQLDNPRKFARELLESRWAQPDPLMPLRRVYTPGGRGLDTADLDEDFTLSLRC